MDTPRSSVDEEASPLLPRQQSPEPEAPLDHILKRVSDVFEEPLTTLTRILLVACLVLLLISSIFIGLFAGLQHRISTELPPDSGSTTTKWRTETATATATYVSTTTSSTTTTTTMVPPTPSPPPPEPEPEKACMTSECIILSASILSSLDTTQDPCDNFYDFATGGWRASNPLPGDKALFGRFSEVALQNRRIIKQIIDTPIKKPSADVSTHSKIVRLFDSCMNEQRLDELGPEPLQLVIRTIKTLFDDPSAEGTPSTKVSQRDLTAVLAYLHARNIDTLFSWAIEGNVGVDPNFMTLWFYQGGLSLPSKEYYEETSIRETYESVLTRLLYALDEREDKKETLTVQGDNAWPPWPWPPREDPPTEDKAARAKRLAEAVFKFERQLARAGADLDVLQEDPIASYNPAPFSNLTEAIPTLDFPTYFGALFPRNFPETVIITYPPYLEQLSSFLAETETDVLQAYFIARAAFTLAPYLSTNTEPWKIVRELEELLNGLKKGAIGDREEWCLTQVENALGFAVGRFFVEREFGGNSRTKAVKIITDIVDAFKTSVKTLPWMDKFSAKAAAEKASAIRVKVGYPLHAPDTLDPVSVQGYYARTIIDEEEFFSNIVSSRMQKEIWKWQSLGKPRDPESWELFPSTVNAYYNPPASEIVFPAGILRPPFFSPWMPSYLSYGAFGQAASHELTHAFDTAGRLYNQDGKLEPWWTNETSANFDVLKGCIVDQYSKYTVDDGKGNEVHVNGNLTSGENIGDTGIIQSYRAWKAQFNASFEAGDEYLLPGVPYTREQLFFIAFGQIWATNARPSAEVKGVRTDPHSPPRWRVDGTVRNVPEFAKAFNCSVNAKLNPPNEERCLLWS